MTKIDLKILALVLVLATILGACSAEGEPGHGSEPTPDTPPGTFTIFTRADNASTPVSGVSSGWSEYETVYGPEDGTHDNELIQDWVVFFIKTSDSTTSGTGGDALAGSGTVGYVATSGDATSKAGDDFSFTLPKDSPLNGTYTIVAFANTSAIKTTVGDTEKSGKDAIIPLMGISGATDYAGCVGKTVDLTDLRAASVNLPASTVVAGETETVGRVTVPFSGFRENVVIVNNESQTTYTDKGGSSHFVGSHSMKNCIEVIRMYAKVEIKLLNSTDGPLALEEVDFGIVNKGAVSLLPDYDILGTGDEHDGQRPSIISEDSETLTLKPATAMTIGTGNEDKKATVIFYVRESDAGVTHPATGRFMLTMKFRRSNGTTLETHYSPTDALQWINRNDHIIIPVKITDVTVDWEVLFYPPIGGYPAVVESKDPFNYWCTFGTQGEFEISPVITGSSGQPLTARYVADKTDTSTDWPTSGYYPCYSLCLDEIKEYKVITDGAPRTDGISIFTKKPAIVASTGEILGELSTNKGIAIVPITIYVKMTKDTDPVERHRNIYILRAA